jgi:membrane protein involved in colicin uptake
MNVIYSGISLNRKVNRRGEQSTIRNFKTPNAVEQLQEQIEYLTERVKQLEIEHAWNQKSSLFS